MANRAQGPPDSHPEVEPFNHGAQVLPSFQHVPSIEALAFVIGISVV